MTENVSPFHKEMIVFFLLVQAVCCLGLQHTVTYSLPPVTTSRNDQYLCFAHFLKEVDEAYIRGITISADPNVAHHVASCTCRKPNSIDLIWDCTAMQGNVCQGDAVNFGVWDHDTENSGHNFLPGELRVRAGKNTPLKYFVTQVHFRDIVDEKKISAANLTLHFDNKHGKLNYQSYVNANRGYIPMRMSKGFFAESACTWTRPPVFVYRYFVHTHHHGLLVEGFLVRNNTWTLLGSHMSMQKKSDYYDVIGRPVRIEPGDIITSRCLYVNPSDKPINFGMTREDEMCNFQLDFGYETVHAASFNRGIICLRESPSFSFCDYSELTNVC